MPGGEVLTMKTSSWRPSPLIAGALAAGWSLAAMAQAVDPSRAPMPDVQGILVDARRALVLETRIGAGVAQRIGAYVSDTPPGSHVGDPAHLHIRWFDVQGNRIGGRNAWDPRWEFRWDESGEQRVILPAADGVFAIPFSQDIAAVSITEVASGQVLLQTDVRDVVQAFCIASPGNPNCSGELDSDGDTVADSWDICPGTVVPESVPTSGSLGSNRWALRTHGGVFTQAAPQSGAEYGFHVSDTAGCSCEQIVAVAGVGAAHLRYGCSTSVILEWIGSR
jgi:hypothetical protein